MTRTTRTEAGDREDPRLGGRGDTILTIIVVAWALAMAWLVKEAATFFGVW